MKKSGKRNCAGRKLYTPGMMVSILLLPLFSGLVLAGCDHGEIAGLAADTVDESASDAALDSPVDPFRLPYPVEMSVVKNVPPGLTLQEGETIENNSFTDYYYKKTNIKFKVDWYASDNNYTQKLHLAVESNVLPDAMIVDEPMFRQLAEYGQIEDLTDAYGKYASTLMKEIYASSGISVLENATIDGKLMALPNISIQADSVSMLWVRQDWLGRLGLAPPRTMEDVITIAKAFVEGDPDGNGLKDTVGLSGTKTNLYALAGMYDFTGIFAAHDAFPGLWLRDDEGRIVYGSTRPETKHALETIRGMYASGLIDPDFPYRTEPMDLLSAGRSGMFFGSWFSPWNIVEAVKQDPSADWRPYLIADANGRYNTQKMPVSSYYLVVRKGFAHPEAAIVYANQHLADSRLPDGEYNQLDPGMIIPLSPLYLTIDYADAVSRKYAALVQVVEGKAPPDSLSPEMRGHYNRWLRREQQLENNVSDWAAPHAYLYGGEIVTRKMDKEVYNQFTSMTPAMERKWDTLLKLENETFYKIVLGEIPVDSFDDFVNEWYAQGGQTIIEEIEERIDNR
ncbi:extracellular solute-binding protein [Paenibacillus sp. J2TS4]|uniref:extracellular solute-binding protein n=1 Tax=Paenibacillus sp. J2TS4 TaxID=2807194 RepID=UPI001BD1BB0A|nr:extracellular solute-binding protein [Paenibacillus sp. J2TS4]